MNRKITYAFMAVCCLAVAITVVGQGGGDTSARIQQLEKDMHHAQMSSDVAWYEQHLADGYIEGHSWGDWATKAEAIKQTQDKSIKFNKGDIGDVKLATFGSNAAVAHYKFTYDATFNGTHRARTVICSDTWINQSGAWKLISDHCSHVEGT
jgi:hypothetical protein